MGCRASSSLTLNWLFRAARLSQRLHGMARHATGLPAQGKPRCSARWVAVRATAFTGFARASQLSRVRDVVDELIHGGSVRAHAA